VSAAPTGPARSAPTPATPATTAAPVATVGATAPPGPPDRTDGLGALPDLALAGVTAAAVIGLGRLFTDGSFAGPVLLAAAGAHGLGWAGRRWRLGLGGAALLSVAGLVLYVAWVVEPSTTAFGLPDAATWHAAVADLHAGWVHFGQAIAPVKPEPGYVLAAALATWCAGFVADWAAFRVGGAFESLVPAFTVFVFASALGANRSRGAYTGLFIVAVLAFLLAHGAARRAGSVAWFASRSRGGARAIVQHGLPVAAATLVAAVVVGPLLPGARDPALLDWRNRDNNRGSRLTVSPLVDIRSRLVQQTDTEVFTVKSPVRAYWRLTSLDNFDGQTWGSKGSYRKASGTLRLDQPTRADVRAGVQQFAIEALDTIWLPAAYRPDRYGGPPGVSFDPDSASLLTDASTPAGLVYQVRSKLPALTAAELSGAGTAVPAGLYRHYTELPAGMPAEVTAVAHQVTDGLATPYAKALALQNWFRDNFTYSLNVPPGHNEDAMLHFLAVQRGYCEQFAGTYAAMARAIGLPARVAVGFTPGELRDGLYHVTGRQAHAWPEVFVTGYGWVAFEPTPGRGAPGAQAYTGVPEEQDTSAGPVVTPATEPGPATTVAGGVTPTSRKAPSDIFTGPALRTVNRPSPWPGRLLVAGLVVAGLAVAWLVAVPTTLLARRRRRRSRATTPGQRTLVAWAEASEVLAMAGLARRPAETNQEYARRAGNGHTAELTALAHRATAAAFGPGEVDEAVADQAEEAGAAVVTAVRESTGLWRRARWWLDPRPLLRSVRRTRR
jgi:transglutaminase-like putative cysteine protease